jgi:hypothetical protein
MTFKYTALKYLRTMPNSDSKNTEVMEIIESALDLAGKGSKQVIINYLQMRYGMNTDLIVQYKTEFENYLRETLGSSAEIIISRIDEKLRHDDKAGTFLDKESRFKKTSRISACADFLICDNCFWCASLLRSGYESKCMSCGSPIISAIPVMHNEKFLVEVDKKRGVTLSFRLS